MTEQMAEEFQPGFRTKRRAAKVDYTEKKEDYDFEASNKTNKRSSSVNSSPTKDATKKKKKTNGSNGKGSASRSESPILSIDPDLDLNSPVPLNYQPDIKDWKFSNILNLEGAIVRNRLQLVLKDGTTIKKDENVYMICEPPGEPYYIGRIMGFINKNKQKQQDKVSADVEEPAEDYSFKINWWYRCRDISKHSTDSRLVYASMHSDVCPIQSFRGKCVVKHKDEIDDLDEYKLKPNQFWFDKFFDRYMIKFYDVLPTSLLLSLPINYRTALNKRFQYIFLEQGKVKDMLQQPKSCVKCHQWSSSSDSIECCECADIYHMLCLDPPLLKKPARGFAWSCIKCTKSLERKKMIQNNELVPNAEDLKAEITSPVLPNAEAKKIPLYEELAIQFLEKDRHLSFQQRRNSEEWIYRYLGVHARLEDSLDLQDRPYPRAASRLGPKNQLTGFQLGWYNHPVVYYDVSELNEDFQNRTFSHGPTGRKKKVDGRRKKNKNDNDEHEKLSIPLKVPPEFQDVDPDDFPPWLQRRPKNYIERGGDDGRTSKLLWKNPETLEGKTDPDEINEIIDRYIKCCDPIAERIGLIATSPNFQDALMNNLFISDYNIEKAMKLNETITKTTLREPQFSSTEIKKFEDGIKKYGSELWPTFKEVKTQPFSMIVRFYYLWKKTANGRLIWGNFADRRKFKSSSKIEETKDKGGDIANDHDDSSYDMGKTTNKEMRCKHCKTNETKQWFRSPGQQHPDDSKTTQYALCLRCARLWRRYAVIWEDPHEVYRKTNQKGGNGWKRKVEQELAVDAELIFKARHESAGTTPESKVKKNAIEQPLEPVSEESPEKKLKKIKENEPSAKPKKNVSVKPPKEEKVEPISLLVPNVLNEINTEYAFNVPKGLFSVSSSNPNLQTALNERYYQITSSNYNSRPKFRENFKNTPVSSEALPPKVENYDPCSVCLHNSEQETHNLLKCSQCRISVHASCYGVNFDSSLVDEKGSLSSYRWCCDYCSNESNPIISRDYTCVICNSKKTYGACKRTLEGEWVHVICSLLCNDLRYLDINSLQPIIGTEKFNFMKKPVMFFKCAECTKHWSPKEILSGENCKFGFKLIDLPYDSKLETKTIRIGNLIGKFEPVLICKQHDSEKFYSPQTIAKRHKQSTQISLLRIFLEDSKRSEKSNVNGAALRSKQLKEIKEISKKHVDNDHDKDISKKSTNGVVHRSCSSCGKSSSMFWFSNDTCYSCHSGSGAGNSVADYKQITEDDNYIWSKYHFRTSNNKIEKPAESFTEIFTFKECELLNGPDAFEKWSNDFNPFKKPSFNHNIVLEPSLQVVGIIEPEVKPEITNGSAMIHTPVIDPIIPDTKIDTPDPGNQNVPLGLLLHMNSTQESRNCQQESLLNKSENDFKAFVENGGQLPKTGSNTTNTNENQLLDLPKFENDADGDVVMSDAKAEPEYKHKMSIGNILD